MNASDRRRALNLRSDVVTAEEINVVSDWLGPNDNGPEHDPLRAVNIGASEVPALFSLPWGGEFGEDDLRPFETRFSLWNRKRGNMPSLSFDNKRTKWGRRLEAAIAAGVADETGWPLRRAGFVTHPTLRGMSATPDYTALLHDEAGLEADLELKNVDRLEHLKWPKRVEPGVCSWNARARSWEEATRQPPFRVKLQVQHQLACTGRQVGVIGAFIGGNDLELYRIDRHAGVVARIEKEVADFWISIDADAPPPPDWSLDGATIAALLGFAEPGSVADFRDDEEAFDLALEYSSAGQVEKAAKERKEIAKAKLMMMIGNAEKALLPQGFTVSAGMVAGCEISYYREPYRAFRLTHKKGRK